MTIPNSEKIRRYDLLCSTVIARVEAVLNEARYNRRYDETLPSDNEIIYTLLASIDDFFAGNKFQDGYALFQTIIFDHFNPMNQK